MRERVIERYLHQQVTKAGGTTRKLKGRKNDPDRLVLWPRGEMHFVETKATGKDANAGQIREHKRLRALGCEVWVINCVEAIDNYVTRMRYFLK